MKGKGKQVHFHELECVMRIRNPAGFVVEEISILGGQVQLTSFWSNGHIRDVAHITLEQLIEGLKDLRPHTSTGR